MEKEGEARALLRSPSGQPSLAPEHFTAASPFARLTQRLCWAFPGRCVVLGEGGRHPGYRYHEAF